MKREFKRDLNNNYMILSEDAFKSMEDYRVRMLISNKILFILPCNIRKFDGLVKYYYEITSKHPINRVFNKKKIGREVLNIILGSFLKVLDSSVDYLLNPNDFILDPEYIYMNIESNEIFFCYMPGHEADISKSFSELSSYLLENIDHDDKHIVAITYELYRQTLNDNYCLRDILYSITESTAAESKLTETVQEEMAISTDYADIQYQKEEEEKSRKKKYNIKPSYFFCGLVIVSALAFLIYDTTINRKIFKGISLNYDLLLQIGGMILIVAVITAYVLWRKYLIMQEAKEEDNMIIIPDNKRLESNNKEQEVFNKEKVNQDWFHYDRIDSEEISMEDKESMTQTQTYGNTVLLAYKTVNSKLISTKDNYNNFELSNDSFLIGKMEDHVDGVINDKLISRIHAEIRKNNGKYYLTDLNSTNGTYHNERRLEANETVEINPEDRIRFATVEYVFC